MSLTSLAIGGARAPVFKSTNLDNFPWLKWSIDIEIPKNASWGVIAKKVCKIVCLLATFIITIPLLCFAIDGMCILWKWAKSEEKTVEIPNPTFSSIKKDSDVDSSQGTDTKSATSASTVAETESSLSSSEDNSRSTRSKSTSRYTLDSGELVEKPNKENQKLSWWEMAFGKKDKTS